MVSKLAGLRRVRLSKVSCKTAKVSKLYRGKAWVSTVEHRVGDQPAGIDGYRVVYRSQGAAITFIQCRHTAAFSTELIRVHAFDISPMILEKVGEFVIEEDASWEVCGNIKLDVALQLIEYIKVAVASVVKKGICRKSNRGSILGS